MKSSFALHIGNRLFSIVASVGLAAVLARLVTPVEYGYFNVLTLMAQLTSLVPTAAGMELIQNRQGGDDHSHRVLGLTLAWSAFGAAATLLCAPFLPFDKTDSAQYAYFVTQALVAVPLTNLSVFLDAEQARRAEYNLTIRAEFFANIFGSYALTLALALAGFGAGALVLGTTAYLILRSALQIRNGAWVNPSFRNLGSLFSRSRWILASQAANYLGRNGDNIVIGRLLGLSALGLYSRAFNLMVKPANTVGGAITAVFFPSFTAIQHDRDRAHAMFLDALTALALAVAPASIYLAVFGNDIVAILLGKDWMGVALPFQILALSLYCRVGYKVTESVAFGKGQFKGAAMRQLLYAVMVVAFAFVGAVWANLEGAAAGVSIALAAFFVTSSMQATRSVAVSGRRMMFAQAPSVCAAVLAGACAFVATEPLPGNPLLRLAVGGIVFGVTYAGAIAGFVLLRPANPVALLVRPAMKTVARRLRGRD